MKKYYYFLKSTDRLWIVSLIFINVAVPICNYVFYMLKNMDMQIEMQKIMYFFLPISSVLTPVFIAEQFYSEKSKDVMFFIKPKEKIIYIFIFHFFALMNISVVVLLHNKYIDDAVGFLIKIFCVCIFHFGLSYLAMYLSKTALSTVMVLLLLDLINTIDALHFNLPIFYETFDKLTISLFLQIYFPLLIFGVSAIGFVAIREKEH